MSSSGAAARYSSSPQWLRHRTILLYWSTVLMDLYFLRGLGSKTWSTAVPLGFMLKACCKNIMLCLSNNDIMSGADRCCIISCGGDNCCSLSCTDLKKGSNTNQALDGTRNGWRHYPHRRCSRGWQGGWIVTSGWPGNVGHGGVGKIGHNRWLCGATEDWMVVMRPMNWLCGNAIPPEKWAIPFWGALERFWHPSMHWVDLDTNLTPWFSIPSQHSHD